MQKRERRVELRTGARVAIASAVLLGGLTACHKATKFADTTAIAVAPPVKAPEPVAAPAPAPAPAPARVEVKADRIQINEKVEFDVDKATIKPVSHGLLDEVVQVMKDHPEIKKIEVEGHTDSEGDDKYNLHLSDKRANAVREYLTSHGVDAARLQSKGYGKTKPIADNKTAAGREQNRRVEFMILQQDGGQ